MSNEGWQKPEIISDEQWEKLEEWEKAELARTLATSPPQTEEPIDWLTMTPTVVLLGVAGAYGVLFLIKGGSFWIGVGAALMDSLISIFAYAIMGFIVGVLIVLITRRSFRRVMRIVLVVILWIAVFCSISMLLRLIGAYCRTLS